MLIKPIKECHLSGTQIGRIIKSDYTTKLRAKIRGGLRFRKIFERLAVFLYVILCHIKE